MARQVLLDTADVGGSPLRSGTTATLDRAPDDRRAAAATVVVESVALQLLVAGLRRHARAGSQHRTEDARLVWRA